MLKRIRLLWFTIGCSVSAAGISTFYLKDLWAQQHSLQSQMKQHFESLEARIRDLESIADQTSIPPPPPAITPQSEE